MSYILYGQQTVNIEINIYIIFSLQFRVQRCACLSSWKSFYCFKIDKDLIMKIINSPSSLKPLSVWIPTYVHRVVSCMSRIKSFTSWRDLQTQTRGGAVVRSAMFADGVGRHGNNLTRGRNASEWSDSPDLSDSASPKTSYISGRGQRCVDLQLNSYETEKWVHTPSLRTLHSIMDPGRCARSEPSILKSILTCVHSLR